MRHMAYHPNCSGCGTRGMPAFLREALGGLMAFVFVCLLIALVMVWQ